MALPSPPAAPQRGDRSTFSGRVDAFLTWLTNLIPQLNTFLAGITTLAAGGANAFSYTMDTGTADSDPGPGRVRFNSVNQNASTVLRFNSFVANGGELTTFLNTLSNGTSNVKASVRLQKVGDPNSYLVFDITAISPAGAYRNLTVVPRVWSGTAPFAAADTLAVFFDPRGDRGDGGNTPTQQQMRDAIGTLPIANGGTGATTAGGALSSLGALPTSGGVLSGNLSFASGVGIRMITSTGENRAVLDTGSDNNINFLNGAGGFWRLYSKDGSKIILQSDDGGNFSPWGNLNLRANSALTAADSNGVKRVVVFMGGDNWLNYYGGPTGTRWFNAAQNAVNAVLSDSGAFSANSISANTVTETSDERKKTNWRVLTDAQLDALSELDKVGVFDWIDGTGAAVGASAQQIRAIVPEAVRENIDPDGNIYLSVAYGGLAFAMAQGALRRANRP